MQLTLDLDFFPPDEQEVCFFSENGANFLRFAPDLMKCLHRENLSGLVPGNSYMQIGSGRRSMFCWTVPAVFDGVFTYEDCQYALFNCGLHAGMYWAYAFVVVPENPHILLQFTNNMRACRDIVLGPTEREN